jgi:hypothetical protein
MSQEQLSITFEDARKLANEAVAEFGVRNFAPSDFTHFLSDYHLEAEGCWYFFPMDGLEIPPEAQHSHKFAIAISKSGEERLVADFRDNEQQMKDYLELLSLHFLGREVESRAALAVWQKKYQTEQRQRSIEAMAALQAENEALGLQ